MPHEPSDLFLLGVAEYRAGRYFEAHECWEDLWMVEADLPKKRLLQALIQIAAAMHKLHHKGDARAAIRLLARARTKLPEKAAGAVGLLGDAVDRARGALEAAEGALPGGPEAPDPAGGSRPGVEGEPGRGRGERTASGAAEEGEMGARNAVFVPAIGEDLLPFGEGEG